MSVCLSCQCVASEHIGCYPRVSGYSWHTLFSKTRGHPLFWVPPRLALSGLVLLLLLCLVLYKFSAYLTFLSCYEYPFHTLHNYNIPQGHFANQLQVALLASFSMYGSDIFWTVQDKARRYNTRQDIALRQPDKTIMVSPGFEKILYLKNYIFSDQCQCIPQHETSSQTYLTELKRCLQP